MMKKTIAILSACTMLLAFAACGKQGPDVPDTTAAAASAVATTEEIVTADPATQPEEGRVAEKDEFYVYIPEDWCRMEYAGDGLRLRLFDIPSAPDIKQGETPEIEILVSAEDKKKDDVDKLVETLMKNEGAQKGKTVKIDGTNFSVVSYKAKDDKRPYIEYIGLAGGKVATVTLKGIAAEDEDAAAILKSLCFKK